VIYSVLIKVEFYAVEKRVLKSEVKACKRTVNADLVAVAMCAREPAKHFVAQAGVNRTL
jgi:hypothetical protein